MAGHSKFANIKHRKQKNDAKKGKMFTRIGRDIAVAVKSGGADPQTNGKLRDVIMKAKCENMPNDTIERSIKKAAGDALSTNFENIVYEGYGPNGVAVIVLAITDNRNRAAANIRNAFTKGGGNMGASGCVSFMFDEKGLIMIEKEDAEKVTDADSLMLMALDAGASDFFAHEDGFEIITEPDDFTEIREFLEREKFILTSAEVTKIPQTDVELTTPDDLKKMTKLLDLLEDDDDVQSVWHNCVNFN